MVRLTVARTMNWLRARPLFQFVPATTFRVLHAGQARFLHVGNRDKKHGAPPELTPQQKRILYRSKQVIHIGFGVGVWLPERRTILTSAVVASSQRAEGHASIGR